MNGKLHKYIVELFPCTFFGGKIWVLFSEAMMGRQHKHTVPSLGTSVHMAPIASPGNRLTQTEFASHCFCLLTPVLFSCGTCDVCTERVRNKGNRKI